MRDKLAYDNFLNGYNCTQAVVLAFEDLLGMDRDSLLKAVSPFGGGFARLREVCGTVSGMYFVLGALEGYSTPGDNESKKRLYATAQTLAGKFKEETGSIICRELLGLSGPSNPEPEKRTAEYYKKRPCPELCALAARILEDYLTEKGML